jgi:hypothetical protein
LALPLLAFAYLKVLAAVTDSSEELRRLLVLEKCHAA